MTENNYTILDNIPNGVCIIDSRFMMVYFNPCLETWTGMRSAEIIGKDLRKIFPVFSEIRYSGRIESVLKNGQPVLFSSLLHDPFFTGSVSDGVLRRQQITVVAVSGLGQDSARAMLVIKDDTEMINRIELLEKAQRKTAHELKVRNEFEKKVKESEEKYRLLLETSKAGISFLSLDGTYHIANTRAAETWGLKPKDFIGKNIQEILPPDMAEEVIKVIHKIEKTGKGIEQEKYLEPLDKYFIENIQPVRNASGKIIGIQVMTNDITERKKAEEQIKENLQQIELIYANTPNIIWKTDIDKQGNFINQYISTVADDLLSLPIGTINNSWDKYFAYVVPDYLPEINKKFKEAISNPGELISFSYKVKKADGETAWFLSKGKVVLDNNKLTAYGSTVDITDTRQLEKEKRRSEETYQNLLYVLNAGVIVHAPDTSILIANPAALEILGLSMDQMVGKKAIDPQWKFLREDGGDMPLDEYPVNRILSTNEPLHNLVAGVNRPQQGDMVWVLVNGFLVKQDSGQPEQVIINFVDITERKLHEEKITKSLKEKNVLIKEVHHRVKNNLQVITSLLRMQVNQTATEKAALALTEALNRVRTIASVHEQLYKSDNLATVTAREYIGRLFHDLISVARSEGRQIDLQLSIEDIKLNPDNAIPFGLIANELMTNALKYAFVDSKSPQNIIVAEFKKVMKREREPFVQFTFSDNGRGLPDDFDLNKQKSLGIKLIAGLTEQLEGTLKILENEGTGFMIEFPLKQE